MKPITLTISAFGPYADKTVLNFDDLGLQRLFVITGPTGAGKTTVFEAILYALYGKLSKKGMDPASLRCDFLKPEDDALTYVEFEFEIGSKKYHIRRQPKQWVPKKRGDGKREVGQEVVLECVGHTDFLPLTKISEVDAKIVELTGLEEEQFKKIVMLPQGAFQEFLISGTKEKSELLRNIFNTGLYDVALQRLKTRVSTMNDDYKRVGVEYQSKCAMIKADVPISCGELPSEEEIRYLEKLAKGEEAKISELNDKVQQADVAYKTAIDALNKQKQHNEDVRKWQEALAHKDALQKRSDSISEKKQRVIEAEKADAVVNKEDRFLEAQAQLNALQQAVDEIEHQCKLLEEKSNAARALHEKALDEKRIADADYQKVAELTNKLTRLQQYMQKKSAMMLAQQNYNKLNDKQLLAEKILNETTEKLKQAENAAQAQQEVQTTLSNKQVLLVQLNQSLQEGRANYKTTATVLERHKRLQKAMQDAEEKEKLLAEAEAVLEQARAQNRQHVAASLALGLEEGTPCPVCGAIHHPNLATDGGENAAEEALQKARDNAQKVYLQAQAKMEEEKTWLEREMDDVRELNAALMDMEAVRVYQASLVESGEQNKKRYEALNQEVDALKQELATYEEKAGMLASLKQEQSDLQMQYTKVATQVGQAKGVLDQTLAEIQSLEASEGFSGNEDANALENDIERIKKRHQSANDTFEKAQEAHARVLVDKAAAESACVEKKKYFEEHKSTVENFEATFVEARNALFATEGGYLKAKADIAEKAALNQQIDEYKQEWTQAIATCNALEERLEEQKAEVNLQALETECQKWQLTLDEANTALSEQKARCQSNAAIIVDIQALLMRFKDVEEAYGILGQLRDVLDGKNRFNMRFETFAQAYYFESMLEHANERLARMTHGRYSFRRKESVRDGRKQAGLDLDVMDQYTGRARDVATLSGGESFKASLSLALGLADVVTNESGGVELSTIFIDEGFGTLDDESLDDTVETLLQLQDSGRLVGVISHVAELKERIPAHLVVTSGNRGSHAHFEVRE